MFFAPYQTLSELASSSAVQGSQPEPACHCFFLCTRVDLVYLHDGKPISPAGHTASGSRGHAAAVEKRGTGWLGGYQAASRSIGQIGEDGPLGVALCLPVAPSLVRTRVRTPARAPAA